MRSKRAKAPFVWPFNADGRLDLDEIERLAAAARPYRDADGIEGRLILDPRCYARPGERPGLYFQPTARGKQSGAYMAIRAQLRDDWNTDLRASEPEVYIDHLQRALRRELP